MASREVAGTARDTKPAVRQEVRRLGFPVGEPTIHYTFEASSADPAQTELDVTHGGIAMPVDGVGIPVPFDIKAVGLAVSWLSDSVPAGDWSVDLQRRGPGETYFRREASFDAVATS